ncbi:hypothetical protein QWY14_04725 [Planococcus sp. N028]|uniref:YpoC-like domain-containing protein n=1 Tax=Planococcus shixiaomingii TaxID=3058393 RepID=A0ABT8MZN8_9BACL|nr:MULTISPECIES: hypothetical protein [unclassified Planococcus (in: firmicutes)]MDN7241080.1 hypothetical protein [Planococcus sp. N028]WKA53333.1 hypothetical protein QWY21_11745 [Planococcus sp. N022]
MKLSQKLTKEQTDPFFLNWNEKAQRISELHKRRDAQVRIEMQAGILLYKKLLEHCSDSTEKPLMPLNGEERLAFVVSSPGNYAAFRQLDELFSEMKKIIAGKRIQLKRMEE